MTLLVPAMLAAFTLAVPHAGPSTGSPQAADTLTLVEAVRLSLAVDPTVASAEARRAASTADVRVAEARRFPTLSSSAQAVRFEEPMVVAPIHAFDLANAPEFDRLLMQGRAEMAYTLWDGGGRGARIDQARAAESSGAGLTEATRQEVLARTVDAYLAVLTAREVVLADAAHRTELGAERDRVARFLAEGAAPELELLRAEAELSAAAATESAGQARLDLAEATLARLLDVPVSSVRERTLVDMSLTAPVPPANPDGLERHPVMVAAQGRSEAARAGLRAARAAWLPSVRASAAFVEYGGGSADHVGEWQAGLQVEYPLFTGGARSGAVDRAEAEAGAAEAEVARVRRDLLLAADAARSAEEEARARVDALSTAVTRFEELARVEELALEEGVGVQADFLRAQSGLSEARTGLAEARRAVVRARLRLVLSLGRLSPEWIDQNLEPVS
jgi:outer membrane protein TolC